MGKSRGTKTAWWTWVQFGVLCISIPANVLLWLDRRGQEAAQRKAQYTTEAWKALADFEAAMGSLNRETKQAIGTLHNPEASFKRLSVYDSEWLASAVRITTELATKIRNYEDASGSDLPAREYAAMAAKRQFAPPPLFWSGACTNVWAVWDPRGNEWVIGDDPRTAGRDRPTLPAGQTQPVTMMCATYDAPEAAKLVAAWDDVFNKK